MPRAGSSTCSSTWAQRTTSKLASGAGIASIGPGERRAEGSRPSRARRSPSRGTRRSAGRASRRTRRRAGDRGRGPRRHDSPRQRARSRAAPAPRSRSPRAAGRGAGHSRSVTRAAASQVSASSGRPETSPIPAQTPIATASQPRPTSAPGAVRSPRTPAAIAAAAKPTRSTTPGDPEVGRDLQVEELDPPGPLGRGEGLVGLVREPVAGVVEVGVVGPLLARGLPADPGHGMVEPDPRPDVGEQRPVRVALDAGLLDPVADPEELREALDRLGPHHRRARGHEQDDRGERHRAARPRARARPARREARPRPRARARSRPSSRRRARRRARPVASATSDQRRPTGRPSPSATPTAPTTSAAPESAAKSWIPTNDGSRWPGRLPSNSETTPRNWRRPQPVAATLQATSARRSGTASRRRPHDEDRCGEERGVPRELRDADRVRARGRSPRRGARASPARRRRRRRTQPSGRAANARGGAAAHPSRRPRTTAAATTQAIARSASVASIVVEPTPTESARLVGRVEEEERHGRREHERLPGRVSDERSHGPRGRVRPGERLGRHRADCSAGRGPSPRRPPSCDPGGLAPLHSLVSMAPSVLRRRFATAAGLYLSVALGILGTIAAARILGLEDFGRFATVLAVVGLAQTLLDLTVEESLTKFGFRYVAAEDWGKLHRLFRRALELKLLGGGLASIAPPRVRAARGHGLRRRRPGGAVRRRGGDPAPRLARERQRERAPPARPLRPPRLAPLRDDGDPPRRDPRRRLVRRHGGARGHGGRPARRDRGRRHRGHVRAAPVPARRRRRPSAPTGARSSPSSHSRASPRASSRSAPP